MTFVKIMAACTVAASLGLVAPAMAETTLTMATGDAVGSLRNLSGNHVKDALENSGGALRVNHIEGPVLGNAAQLRDQVADGSLDLLGTDAAWLTPYSDFLKSTSFAFVFRDKPHLESVFDSALMDEIVEEVAAEPGVRILGLSVLPSRAFFTKIEPQSVSDFDGLKIRSPQLDNWLASYRALGANPTPVNWNEVFLAIQTGLVDGGHGLPADVLPNNWHMAAPTITDLEDMFAVHAWMINENRWQGLSEAERDELMAALNDASTWMRETSEQANAEAIAEMLEASGGVFISHNAAKRDAVAAIAGEDKVMAFPADERAALREMALSAAKELEGTDGWWDAGLVDNIDAIE